MVCQQRIRSKTGQLIVITGMTLRFHANIWDRVEGVPPRRSVGRTHGSVSGLLAFRGTTAIAYESTLERDFLIRLETDTRVVRVTSQPMTLEYADDAGRQRKYTPDYLVDYDPRPAWAHHIPPAIIEVKPRQKLVRHLYEWRSRYRAAVRYCREHGYIFHLAHEGKIRDQRWENAMFLRRYRKMQFEPVESDWIVGDLRAAGSAGFDQLLSRHFMDGRDKAEGVAHLWHLLAVGRIACDLDLPLSNQTELWVRADER